MGLPKRNLQSQITQGIMVRIVLLIGVQGTGKTWVMKQLIERFKCESKKKIGKIRYHTNSELIVVGKYDNSMFEGSDKLSMAIMSDYDTFMQFNRNCFIVMEGDRFTNGRVVNHPEYVPVIIKITNDGKEGRQQRGSIQKEEIIQRMQSRINNIDANIDVADSNEALNKITDLINAYEVR